ncbi:ABC transporter ATP-binding protein [Erysipelothrix sp. HDW6B]|uniref:ABC transporter ATP-binding protein n=1 Tax=Erysipelothrix sp. HDW6B TaxID=2714929 RepID=UPI00140C2963|nr:ABC transporter ATP-binding protein [Erysipelothrix sp. HDW6B]QIK85382.1 ABC transporter ATP-binding protein [Erysipelothrix sp. HDW6B]
MKKTKVYLLLSITIICSLLAAITLVLTPFYLGKAIDFMIGKDNVDMVGVVEMLKIALMLYGANFILTWLVSLFANQVSVGVVGSLREKLFAHINKLPVGYLDTHSHGDIQSRFAMDSELILDGMYQLITQLIGGIFVVVISAYFMFSINVMMTVIVIALVPLMYITSRLVAKHSLQLYKKQQAIAGEISGTVNEYFANNTLLLAYNHQEDAIAKFEALNAELNDVGERAQFISAITNPTTRVVNNISYLLIGLVGAFAVREWGLTVGLLTSFISYSMMFSKPFNEFSAVVAQVMAGRASLERINAILEEPLESNNDHEQKLDGKVVSFEDVQFSYVEGKPLIKNLSLDIKPLSKVAIVGPTGAGKSTLINLLMRFYDIDSGSIKIDGVDLQSVSKQSIRDTMGIVLQDPWLFEGTIRDNIKYGKVDASDEAMFEVSKQAGCHDYIMSLDKQYDTMIALESKNISLGQRQMITIARALLVDAPIIILDEATSSLDVVTEQHIQSVFVKIMEKRTSFFVAHRLSTVIDSDVILVMKDGQLIEQGNHEELMAQEGFYHKLYMSQF